MRNQRLKRADGIGHKEHKNHDDHKTANWLGGLLNFVIFVAAAVGPGESLL
jgi:hypothetical protein